MSFFDGGIVVISTTIPKRVYDAVKKQHWKHSELYMLGFQTRIGNQPLMERVKVLEAQAAEYKKEYYKLKKLFLDRELINEVKN